MHYEYMWLYQIFYEWLINFLVFDKRQVMNLLSVSCVAKQIGRQQYILNFMLEKIKFKGSIREHTHTCIPQTNTCIYYLTHTYAHFQSHIHTCSQMHMQAHAHAYKYTYTPMEVSGKLIEFVRGRRFIWVMILIVMNDLFNEFGFYLTGIILHISVCIKSKYSLICNHDFIPYLKVI